MLFTQNYLYSFLELQKLAFTPFRQGIIGMRELLSNPSLPSYYSDFGRNYKALFEVLDRLTASYNNKCFGIEATRVNGKMVQIAERVVLSKAFCNLVHFEKNTKEVAQQKLLIVAPLAGHHASLLTDTVIEMLPNFDVYITDWQNASSVPLSQGSFDMDDYIDYVIEFIKHLGPNTSVLAVCQPAVPVLAATCIMTCQQDKDAPSSIILMGGPIDARQNPTQVNEFALQHDIKWFKEWFITKVTVNYPGFMRRVYPGSLQLIGFMNLGLQRHIQSYMNLYIDLVNNNVEEVEKHKKFYDRYLSVIDLPAEFYLQTIKEIFHDFAMAKGEMVSRGRKIDPSCIKNTAVLCVEGEADNITGIGQTKAALNLCCNLPDKKKRYHLEPSVGHYGIFSGGKFRRNIAPIICSFIAENR